MSSSEKTLKKKIDKAERERVDILTLNNESSNKCCKLNPSKRKQYPLYSSC